MQRTKIRRRSLAHFSQVLETLRDTVQRSAGIGLLLDNVPLRAADGFAELEQLAPSHRAFTERRSRLSTMLLDVDRECTTRELLEDGMGILS